MSRPASTVQPSLLAVCAAGRTLLLPAHRVTDVTAVTQPAPVPLTPPSCEGIIVAGCRAVTQFDVGNFLGEPARSGKCAVLFESDLGPVSLRVTAAGLHTGASGGSEDGLAVLAELLAGYVPAHTARPDTARPDTATPDTGAHRLTAVLIASDDRVVAIPAAEVERIARHDGYLPGRETKSSDRYVAIGDDILPARSLASWLGGGACACADEAWALVLDRGGKRVAITAERVEGIQTLPCQSSASHDNTGKPRWLRHDIHGWIEVLSDGARTAPKSSPAVPATKAAAATATVSGMVVSAGGAGWVIPAELVIETQAVADLTGVAPGRRPRARPVIDLTRLPGDAAGPQPPRYAVTVARGRRRPAVLLTVAAAITKTVGDWLPLPVLPAAMAEMTTAIRIQANRCEFLLRHTTLSGQSWRVATAPLTAAVAGWRDAARLPESVDVQESEDRS